MAAAAVEQLSIWGEEANALREFAWFVVNRKS
jgi:hypothetical protein